MRKTLSLILAATISAATLPAMAGDGREAVIGSIIGGATGAIIGNNLGGRDGAIVGGAIGAAAGVVIATDQQRDRRHEGYEHRRDDHRHRNDGYARYERDDRYNRYDDRRYGHQREVVVVESPRHYYQGNEFVYGLPPRHDNGRHRGWQQGRRDYDRGGNVIIVQQDDGRYCPPPRRW